MSQFFAEYPVFNGGVQSLNGLTGALTLVGGTGISITPAGSNITISSSALLSAITSINTDTTAAQTLSVGTSGSDFAILDAGGGSHVFNLPTSSASNRGALSSADWSTFNSKQAAGNYITALTGDGTATGPGSVAFTLATVNGNVGSFGSSTAIPSFTVNGKGLITAASTNVVIAPALTLTGTTLASNVVTSSLTSVGTITSGTWNGTTIDVAHGGTSLTTLTANNVILGNGTSAPTFVAPGTSGNILTSNGTTWTSASASSSGTVAPTANTLLLRDANGNGRVNILGVNAQNIAAAAGITDITAASPAITTITAVGSNGQNIRTGDATTLAVGMTFYFYNYATGNCQILRHDNTVFTTLKTNGYAMFQLVDNSTSNGVWSAYIAYYNTSNSLFLIGTIDTVATSSDGLNILGNTLTAQSATATLPGMVNTTAQTFAGVKTFNSAPVMSGASISNNTITNASRTQMAAHTMKGNNTGSTANEADLTLTQVRAEVYATPTIQRFLSGSGTYTTPANCLRIIVQVIGGGGGGAGSGTVGGGTGTTGGDTTFGSSLITGSGGVGGVFGIGSTPGAGGAASAGAATAIITMAGNAGQGAGGAGTAGVFVNGGEGGNGISGGSGYAQSTGTGSAPQANSGAGGAGAGANGVINSNAGTGGGSGGYVMAQISAPSATYAYAVGAKGTGGTAGTLGFAGTDGGSGIIIVTEYYN